MDIAHLALMIPIIGVCIPIVAILVDPLKRRMAMDERREARKLYERIATEKLDVMKTAIAMGYGHDDLRELDQRLQKLIGADEVAKLLEPGKPSVPIASMDLKDIDITGEMERQSRKRRQAE
jgi:hypothetical protein